MRSGVTMGLAMAAGGVAACTSLLGDFTVAVTADGSTDAGTDTAELETSPGDATQPVDGSGDVGSMDAPADVKPDTPPTCGLVGLPCCAGSCTTGACCNTTCVDTTKDAKNCGACGHDCLLGQCGASACTPTALATVTSKWPSVIAVDANVVYWGQVNGGGSLQAGGLYACDKVSGCGNNPTELVGSIDYPRSLVLYGTDTYTADGNAGLLDVCKITGCAMSPTQYNVSNITSIAIDNGKLLYLSSGEPYEANLDVTNPIDLATAPQSGTDLVVTGQYAYYTNFDSVRFAKEGVANGASDYFSGAAGEQYGRIATDGTSIVWHAYVTSSSDDSVFACAAGSACTARTILATGQHFSYSTAGLAADSGMAYWTAQSQTGKDAYVRKCATSGCNSQPVEVAHVVTSTIPWVGGVAVDASYVYFPVDDNGVTTIYRVVR